MLRTVLLNSGISAQQNHPMRVYSDICSIVFSRPYTQVNVHSMVLQVLQILICIDLMQIQLNILEITVGILQI